MMNDEHPKDLPQLRWTPELAHKFWNRLAGTKFLERIAFSRFAAPYLVSLVRPYFPDDANVLDFGSGYNLYLVRELLRHGYKTAFYEPSVPAEEQLHDLHDNPSFLGPMNEIGADKFDVAFLSEVIEHLSDDEATNVLRMLNLGLRSNGILVLTTPCSENLFEASRLCPVCEHLFHPWGHVQSFSPEAIEGLLQRNGFHCETLWNVDFSSARQSVEELSALKTRIASILQEAREQQVAEQSKDIADHRSSFTSRFIAAFEELNEFRDSRDPARCQIGLGGNIVTVARKGSQTPRG